MTFSQNHVFYVLCYSPPRMGTILLGWAEHHCGGDVGKRPSLQSCNMRLRNLEAPSPARVREQTSKDCITATAEMDPSIRFCCWKRKTQTLKAERYGSTYIFVTCWVCGSGKLDKLLQILRLVTATPIVLQELKWSHKIAQVVVPPAESMFLVVPAVSVNLLLMLLYSENIPMTQSRHQRLRNHQIQLFRTQPHRASLVLVSR